MTPRQMKAMLAGAAIGACVGGFYALVLVSYRDMVAARQAGVGPDGKPCGPCAEKAKREALASNVELHDKERTVERPITIPAPPFKSTAQRAREIRAEHPDMRWQDAMRAAAGTNGTASASEEVKE